MYKENNSSLSNKKSRLGIYATASVLIALILLIVINAVVEIIPKKYTLLDISEDKIYTLSSKSTDFLKTVNENITIYYICAGGVKDNQITTFLSRYEEENKKINVIVVDPLEDTGFIEKYSDESLDNYSLIVESSKRYRIVNYSDLNYYYNEQVGPVSATTYEQYLLTYGEEVEKIFTHYFGGETALTGAIEYVLGDVKKVYALTGHNEGVYSESVAQILKYADIASDSLNLKALKAIPNDATAIIINAPQTDITENEASLLMSFIQAGGDLFLATDSNYLELPNLLSVMNSYGLSCENKTVADIPSVYDSTAKIIVPQTNSSHKLLTSLGESYILYFQNAHGISISDTLPESYTATALFYTTDNGYYIDNADTKSKITLGAIVENSNTGANILWVSSSAILSETFSNPQYYGNPYYFAASLLYFGDVIFKSQLPTISPTVLAGGTLSVSDFASSFWSVTFIVVIPVIFIALGVIISVRRKYR